MQNSFVFVLGRNNALSVAEIRAVFKKNGWDLTSLLESKEVLLVESKTADSEKLHKTLGGTVKIGKVVSVVKPDELTDLITADFLLGQVFARGSGKIQFGISIYDGGDKKLTEDLSSQISYLSKGIKALLEEKDVSARFAFSRDRHLSSVTVDKNKLIVKGAEILLVASQDMLYVGKTISVQEYEAFSGRDYARPSRDMKSGVMPPKLARMMINLAQAKEDEILLDPFCGSGTVLQEAAILGYKRLIGRDISVKAVEDTRINMKWLFERVQIQGVRLDVQPGDVKNLSLHGSDHIGAIVTEPYLGPTLHGQLYEEKLKNIQQELKSLYLRAFESFKTVLKPQGVVVMILPVFVQKGHLASLDILPDIEKIGFVREKLSDERRATILYGDSYDYVIREIVKFKLA